MGATMRAELRSRLRAVARGEISPNVGVTGVPGVTECPSYVSKPLELQRLRALRAENQKAEDGVAKGVTKPGVVGSLKRLGDAPSGGAAIEPNKNNAPLEVCNEANIFAPLWSSSDGTIRDWQAFFDERVRKVELAKAMSRSEAEQIAFEGCIVEWLNRNPARSTPGLCDWCGGHEKHGAPILPFGVTPHGHTWLHGECWKPWYDDRRRHARAALSQFGIRGRRLGHEHG
jgi:hypothetical protein